METILHTDIVILGGGAAGIAAAVAAARKGMLVTVTFNQCYLHALTSSSYGCGNASRTAT